MSSILKALKKLEKETLEQQFEPRLSMGLNIRSEKNRRQENSRRQNKRANPWVWTASLFVCFLGAGAFMTLFSHDTHTEVSNNTPINLKSSSTAKPEAAVIDPPQFTDSRTPAHPPHSQQKAHDKPPQTKMPPPREEKSQEIALTRPVADETEESIIPMDHAAPPEPSDLTPPAMAKALPPAIAEEPPDPTLAVTHQNRNSKIDKANETDNFSDIPSPGETPSLNEIPILNNSLIINAIAWSNDPAKRLAVINSAIVRQGQSIGRFLVVEIEENQVIVQQSNKKWRVMFRLR